MGTFFYPITLIGANGERKTIDALVDTGATFTTMQRDLLTSLGVQPRRRVRMRLADGLAHEQDVGNVEVELDGIEDQTPVIFADSGAPSAIGSVTLETLLLGVDPVNQRLVPLEGWQL